MTIFNCSCNFETVSLKELQRHFTVAHEDLEHILFFDSAKDLIIQSWNDLSIGRGSRRLFLLWNNNYKCSQCNYSKCRDNGKTILEIDHIDGNHLNNEYLNLRVLCPNCHALTPKYRNNGNFGNKKYTKKLRPGNKNYSDRVKAKSIIVENISNEKLKVTVKKTTQKENLLFVNTKLKSIKQQFQDNFKNEVMRLHVEKLIDFSKFGWVQLLSDRLNDKPQNVGRRVRKLMPDFYVQFCFSRQYEFYKNK